MSIWEKSNWRSKPRVQMPDYINQDVLNSVEKQLSSYPPLVFAGEARNLKEKLASASKGEAFCCKVAIVLKVLNNLVQTQFEILSKSCFRWRWCLLLAQKFP